MIGDHSFSKSQSGVGVVNTDVEAYKRVVARRKQDKYIKDLEQRVVHLESGLKLLQETIKEMRK